MEFEVSYSLDNEQQFWDELDDIVSTPCPSHALIDNTLRSYLSFTTNYKAEYLNSDYDVARCCSKLLDSDVFTANQDYVRLQIIHCLLQEDAPDVLHIVATCLLFDGRQNEDTFDVMNKHAAFPRLLELILEKRKDEEEVGLHRLLMELLYEMSRIQRIKAEELILVEDEFIIDLFQLIEQLSSDVNDPYHYPIIKVLLVLNEQFMVTAHDPGTSGSQTISLTNKVIKILSVHGSAYRTFGENIILLLNRESETSLQLLTLKLLYLLFTTPSTYEYFYTNDLRVLVDILIRNLLDLPEDASALRHTYLRVLYPLLAHTQLRHPPHYKREEVRKLLRVLMRGMGEETTLDVESPTGIATILTYFGEVDETTRRLVGRCGRVFWLREDEPASSAESPTQPPDTNNAVPQTDSQPTDPTITTPTSPTASSNSKPARPPNPRRESKKLTKKKPPLPTPKGAQTLGMDLAPARESSLSVLEVAAQREKPGIMTPSRRGGMKPVPLPPPARGWGRRKKIAEEEERRRRRIVEEESEREKIRVDEEKQKKQEDEEREREKERVILENPLETAEVGEKEKVKRDVPLKGTSASVDEKDDDDGDGDDFYADAVSMNGVASPGSVPGLGPGPESETGHDVDGDGHERDPNGHANGDNKGKLGPELHVLVEKVTVQSPFDVEAESEGG